MSGSDYDGYVRRKFRHLERAFRALEQRDTKLMATIDDLVTDVAAQKTVIDGLDTLLANIAAQIAALKSTQTDPATAAKIDQLATDVTANTARISADVAANTPSA